VLHCDNCARPLNKNKFYTLRVDLYLTPRQDENGRILLENDAHHTLEEAVAEMEELSRYLSEEEIEEMHDEIAETYRFYLCAECRLQFHKRFKEHFLRRYWRKS